VNSIRRFVGAQKRANMFSMSFVYCMVVRQMNFSEEILRDPATNIIGRLEEATRKDVRKMSVEACWHRADFNFYKISGPALSCLHPFAICQINLS